LAPLLRHLGIGGGAPACSKSIPARTKYQIRTQEVDDTPVAFGRLVDNAE
jgi:hypothetical protein